MTDATDRYEEARAELKRRLAGDPGDAEAIDRLMRLEREAFEHRQSLRRAEENPGRSRWVDSVSDIFTIANHPWILALLGGCLLIDRWRKRRRREQNARPGETTWKTASSPGSRARRSPSR
jgi:hypothetical protein